jgi:hypothetical protein
MDSTYCSSHVVVCDGTQATRTEELEQGFRTFTNMVSQIVGNLFYLYAINFAVIFIGEVGKGVPQRMNGQYVVYRIDDGRRVFVNPDEMPNTELELVELKMIPVLRETEGTISVFSELTEAEYYQRTLPVVRGFSGHWMLFFLVPALYFWYKEP